MSELECEASVHNLLLNLVPVRSKRYLPCLSHLKGLVRFGCTDDLQFVWMTFELLGLEVMFGGGVDYLILLELGWIEVGQVSMLFVFLVELDRSLLLLLHG